MAFEPKISFSSLLQDGSGVILKDETGLASENSTGYGSPNPDKSSFGRVVFSVLHSTKEDVILEPDDYNAGDESIDTFNVKLKGDGVHTHHMKLLNIFDSGASYSNGDIVFKENLASKPFGGDIQKMVDGTFVGITLEELLDETILYKDSDSKLHKPDVDEKFLDLSHSINMHYFGIEVNDIAALQKQQNRQISMMVRMRQEFCNGNNYESQRTVEAFHKAKSFV